MTPSAIEHFAVDVTRTRVSGTTYDAAGFAVTGSSASEIIRAVIQPVSDKDLRDLPEGLREEAQYRMRTREDVAENDEIEWSGETFRVLSVQPWRSHFKATLGLVTG